MKWIHRKYTLLAFAWLGAFQLNAAPVPSPSDPTEHPAVAQRNFKTDVLLFTGNGTWGAEVASLENILSSHGASFREVTGDELDQMSLEEISQFGMLLFPGGNGEAQTNSLSQETHARIRAAVQQVGVGYFGICAGAFMAVAPKPQPGQDVSYGLGVVDGPILDYYYLQNEGVNLSMTLEKFADGTTRDILWYGGPITPDTPKGVIARYPDGTPAISQLHSGNGFVILSAVHPTATEDTLSSLGLTSSDGTHFDLVWNLVFSTLHHMHMPTF